MQIPAIAKTPIIDLTLLVFIYLHIRTPRGYYRVTKILNYHLN
jgi:hypothetical protein